MDFENGFCCCWVGFEVYLVGGCVRDVMMKRTPKDFDILTTAELREVICSSFLLGPFGCICLHFTIIWLPSRITLYGKFICACWLFLSDIRLEQANVMGRESIVCPMKRGYNEHRMFLLLWGFFTTKIADLRKFKFFFHFY